MLNIQKSLATLVKYNGGFFKSEKQAKFLLDVTGGHFVVSNAINLGHEYQNKLVGQGASTSYTLDSKGVVLVERKNAKGLTVVFNRNCSKSIADNKAKLQKALEQKERDLLEQAKHDKFQALYAFDNALQAHIKSLLNTSISELFSNKVVGGYLTNYGAKKGLTNKVAIMVAINEDHASFSNVLDSLVINEGLPTMADKIEEVLASPYYNKVKAYRATVQQGLKDNA